MTTIHLTARDLRDLLTPVFPFAGKDDMLPVLTGIYLKGDGKTTVTAMATDRFRFAVTRDTLLPHTKPFDALIRAVDLKRALMLFKATRWDNPSLELRLDGDHLTLASREGFDTVRGATLNLACLDGDYPDLGRIIRDGIEATGDRVDTVGVNAAFLSDFKAVIRHGDPLAIRTGIGPGKPLLILAGDHFIGGLMPRRVLGGDSSKAFDEAARTWLPLFAEPAPTTAPAKKTTARKPAAKKAPARRKAATA